MLCKHIRVRCIVYNSTMYCMCTPYEYVRAGPHQWLGKQESGRRIIQTLYGWGGRHGDRDGGMEGGGIETGSGGV